MAAGLLPAVADGTVSVGIGYAAGAAAVGSAGILAALSVFSQQLVGQISRTVSTDTPNHQEETLTLSRINFWGSRVDEELLAARVVPPFRGLSLREAQGTASKTFVRVDVQGKTKPMLLSIRHGEILDVQGFNRLVEWPVK